MTRRHPRLLAAAAAAAVTLATLAACADRDRDDPGSAGDPVVSASFPVTAGGLTLDARPERIVSLSATATEMLFAVGAGGQVVAVDDNSNYPPEAPKTDLSGYQPNAEAVAQHDPDLVVISNDLNKIKSQLEQLKIPVLLAGAAVTLDDTYQQLTDLGALTGHPDEAADVVRRMRADVEQILSAAPDRADKQTYYYELGTELYSLTSKTFVGSLFAMAGLENIADPADADGKSAGYPQLSEEYIVKADPDLIFLADTKCCGQSAETVAARPGWSEITAVREGRVVALDDDVASRWGPRVVDLLRAIVDATAAAPVGAGATSGTAG